MSHNRIVMGISAMLYNFFKGSKCTPYSEQSGMITQYTLTNQAYRTPKVLNSNDTYVSSVFPELKIDLKDIF